MTLFFINSSLRLNTTLATTSSTAPLLFIPNPMMMDSQELRPVDSFDSLPFVYLPRILFPYLSGAASEHNGRNPVFVASRNSIKGIKSVGGVSPVKLSSV